MSLSTNYARSTRNSDPEAESCNKETQQSIAITAVPTIDLPHRWDENGALISESSPAQCNGCQWSGDPKYLVKQEPEDEYYEPPFILGKDCQAGPFDCVRCDLMRLVLLQVARDVGLARLDTITLEIHDGNRVFIKDEDIGGTYFVREIFISYDSQSSIIDQYDIVARRMISSGTQWASDLISKCTSLHEECNSQVEHEFLPTRLINIQPNEEGVNPRLSLQSSRVVPPGSQYVALSYCWGDHKPACMTTQFDDKTSIPLVWSDLPRTFQDAANFTQALGIEYLWIDSICIIQGDSKDWNQEAPKMNAVYKNSYVTLAGLCGYDSRNGLRTISMEESSSPIVQLRTAQGTCVLYSRMYHYLESGSLGDPMDNSKYCCPSYPLLSRAWTYQERIVSSRVIFFTESEMMYQCQRHVTCECGSSRDYYGDNSDTISSLNKSKIWSATTRPPDLGSDSPRSPISQTLCRKRMESVARIWRDNVVPEYSRLAVSESRDRLPAVGALAKQFQDARPCEEYLAGLWSGTLLEDLLWECKMVFYDREGLTNKETLARYDGLPTWTWASVPSAVIYRPITAAVPKARFKAQCKYTNNEKFGTLESSRLELEGNVLVCTLEWIKETDGLRPRLFFQNGDVLKEIDRFGGSDPQIFAEIRMDRDQDGFQGMPRQQVVHLMEIMSTDESDQEDGERSWFFLLLRLEAESRGRNPGIQVFTRGGTVTVRQHHFLKAYWLPKDSSSEYVQSDKFETILEQHNQWTRCELL